MSHVTLLSLRQQSTNAFCQHFSVFVMYAFNIGQHLYNCEIQSSC